MGHCVGTRKKSETPTLLPTAGIRAALAHPANVGLFSKHLSCGTCFTNSVRSRQMEGLTKTKHITWIISYKPNQDDYRIPDT